MRNRIKRLLREAFRAHAHAIKKPCLILLIPRVAKAYTYAAFERDIGRLLKKEKLVETRTEEDISAKLQTPAKDGV